MKKGSLRGPALAVSGRQWLKCNISSGSAPSYVFFRPSLSLCCVQTFEKMTKFMDFFFFLLFGKGFFTVPNTFQFLLPLNSLGVLSWTSMGEELAPMH